MQDLSAEFRGEVYLVGGDSFEMISGGKQAEYAAADIGSEGIVLKTGDAIHTNAGNFVEIELFPGDAIIRVAENTAVVFNGIEANSVEANKIEVSLSILYGRLRVMTGGEQYSISVTGGACITKINGGDIGVDYSVQRRGSLAGAALDMRPILQVYAFSGKAEMLLSDQYSPGTVNGAPGGIEVNEQEMVLLESLPSRVFIERQRLAGDITAYWARYPLRNGDVGVEWDDTVPPAEPVQLTTAQSGAVLSPNPVIPPGIIPDFTAARRVQAGKNVGIITGILLAAAGIAVQSYAYYINPADRQKSDILMIVGYVPIGTGLLSLFSSLFINPKLP
ncbi:hypothetical protein FACS1894151_07180 [Spirochaetia bacterium]|nr:hypothetical protein FACS1894151_07180 [Spirochaetia bacterium]